MKREFEITFGFWFTHTLGYFEIEDLDEECQQFGTIRTIEEICD